MTRGPKRKIIWRVIAFDILSNLLIEDMTLKYKKLFDDEEIQTPYRQLLRIAILETASNFKYNLTKEVTNNESKELFDKTILDLDKHVHETWGAYFKRKQFLSGIDDELFDE